MVLKERLAALKKRIPPQTCLIAVSKTHPASSILEAYACGQRVYGENKVQELCAKQEELPGDIEWHMIGHLQSNKVKYIAPRSEEHTSELQSRPHLVCRLLLEKKKKKKNKTH